MQWIESQSHGIITPVPGSFLVKENDAIVLVFPEGEEFMLFRSDSINRIRRAWAHVKKQLACETPLVSLLENTKPQYTNQYE